MGVESAFHLDIERIRYSNKIQQVSPAQAASVFIVALVFIAAIVSIVAWHCCGLMDQHHMGASSCHERQQSTVDQEPMKVIDNQPWYNMTQALLMGTETPCPPWVGNFMTSGHRFSSLNPGEMCWIDRPNWVGWVTSLLSQMSKTSTASLGKTSESYGLSHRHRILRGQTSHTNHASGVAVSIMIYDRGTMFFRPDVYLSQVFSSCIWNLLVRLVSGPKLQGTVLRNCSLKGY